MTICSDSSQYVLSYLRLLYDVVHDSNLGIFAGWAWAIVPFVAFRRIILFSHCVRRQACGVQVERQRDL